ncbi:DUF2269 family protein [Sneathiella sp. P13V-1]|uniref:DUF2269 family protein n=1 Tax=Sneathiella sp. P13V-1 TaxID=2697366 RepID=UPI00187B3573|nr:DUF2269 family protein [Sneathiella sp. P13V-1]MBE7638019.1 DUF2269 family protein [Sneathiella sp. P13V-1]
MIFKILKVFHIVAICVFVGSIPSHIILGEIAQVMPLGESFVAIYKTKAVLTYGLTAAGLAMSVISGGLIVLRHRAMLKTPWLRLKLVLVAGIVINAVKNLIPIAKDMSVLAAQAAEAGSLPPEFLGLKAQEAIFGPINLALIICVIILSVAKPSLWKKVRRAQHG